MTNSTEKPKKSESSKLSQKDLELEFPDWSGMKVQESQASYEDMTKVSEWYLPACNAERRRRALADTLRNNSKPFEL